MVETVTWVARRVPAEQLDQVRAMSSALGFAVLADTADQVTLQTERGDVLEFCGPDYPVPEYLFSRGDTVVGFKVDDLSAAAERLANAGFTALAPAGDAGPVRYQHFVGPHDAVYGLICMPDNGE